MSANRLVFDGLAELRAQLRQLPTELAGDAQGIVGEASEGAAAEIQQQYAEHRVTGNLEAGVYVRKLEVGVFGAGALVVSKSPHAVIFENGTQVRHDSQGRNRGAMPPGRVFVPIVIRRRRQMYGRLIGLLRAAGLQVSGA